MTVTCLSIGRTLIKLWRSFLPPLILGDPACCPLSPHPCARPDLGERRFRRWRPDRRGRHRGHSASDRVSALPAPGPAFPAPAGGLAGLSDQSDVGRFYNGCQPADLCRCRAPALAGAPDPSHAGRAGRRDLFRPVTTGLVAGGHHRSVCPAGLPGGTAALSVHHPRSGHTLPSQSPGWSARPGTGTRPGEPSHHLTAGPPVPADRRLTAHGAGEINQRADGEDCSDIVSAYPVLASSFSGWYWVRVCI